MSTMRKMKKKMVESATSNPHRRRFLIKHRKIKSEIDPTLDAKNWEIEKQSRKLIKRKRKPRIRNA